MEALACITCPIGESGKGGKPQALFVWLALRVIQGGQGGSVTKDYISTPLAALLGFCFLLHQRG